MKGAGRGLPRGTVVAYAMPAIALGVPTIPVFVYLPSFYADTLGLGLTAVGFALFAIRFFDIISDPIVGILSDRVATPFGRRRPWIVRSSMRKRVSGSWLGLRMSKS